MSSSGMPPSGARSSAPDPWVGSVVGGRWKILSLLDDSGGMASVYLADDTRLPRKAVVKIPKAAQLNAEFAKRFAREAHHHATVENVHVVNILDRGEERGTPFLVLQYLPGGNLKAWCAKSPSILDDPRLHFESWLLPIAEALDAVAAKGIVHRDVKPTNILFDAAGKGYLSDFGIVKVGSEATLTGTGLFIGTLQFMSPEQCQPESKRSLDGRSDQFGLAVTVYQVLTGWKYPVEDDTAVVYAAKFGHVALKHPRDHVPRIPAPVNDAVMRALSPDRAQRFATSVEFADAVLVGFDPAGERRRATRPPTAPIDPTPHVRPDGPAEAQREQSRRPPSVRGWRHAGLAKAAVALLVVGIGAGVLAYGVRRPLFRRTVERGSFAGEERHDNGLSMPLVWVPSGRFRVRNEHLAFGVAEPDAVGGTEPERNAGWTDVSVDRGFWIGKCEVTLAEWCEVMGPDVSATCASFSQDEWGPKVSLNVRLPEAGKRQAGSVRPEGDPVEITIDTDPDHYVAAWPQQPLFFEGHSETFGALRDTLPPLVSTTIQLEPLTPPSRSLPDIDGRKLSIHPGRSVWRGNLGVGGRCLYGRLGLIVSNDTSCTPIYLPIAAGSFADGGLARHPVFTVTLRNAEEFCSRLTARERRAGRLPVGWEYRLPTEVEWERAARAGAATEFAFGDEWGAKTEQGFVREGVGWFEDVPRQVGTKPGNAWGIFDAYGNAPEWCLRSQASSDTAGTAGGAVGWLRGGGGGVAAGSDDVGGLRVVLAPTGSE